MSKITVLKAFSDNYIYVFEKQGKCFVVDPGDAAVVEDFLKTRNLDLQAILLTHDHSDHIGGVDSLCSCHSLEVIGQDGPRFCHYTKPVNDLKDHEVLSMKFQVIATPGHTLSHLVYYFPGLGALFSGDTLFAMGCGRLFEGSAEQMFSSFQKLKKLPKETKVYSGHEYTDTNLSFALSLRPNCPKLIERKTRLEKGEKKVPFTLQDEFETNPFFLAKDAAEFGKLRTLRDAF